MILYLACTVQAKDEDKVELEALLQNRSSTQEGELFINLISLCNLQIMYS